MLLAKELGYSHPDILLDELTLEQLNDWKALYNADPWGGEREDLRMAVNTMWQLSHLWGARATDLPGLHYPYFTEAKSVQQSVSETMEFIAKHGLNHLATIDSHRDGHGGPASGGRAGGGDSQPVT